MSLYYVDKRIYEIVKDLDTRFLAPELYYEYRRGVDDDLIKETWEVEDGRRIDFVYLIPEKRPLGYDVNVDRIKHFKKHNTKAINLIAYTVPPQWFDETIKRVMNLNK